MFPQPPARGSGVGLAAILALGLVGQAGAASSGLTREEEPVILAGEALAAWAGAPLDDLFLYAFRQGQGWRQILRQFDEKDASDRYVAAQTFITSISHGVMNLHDAALANDGTMIISG